VECSRRHLFQVDKYVAEWVIQLQFMFEIFLTTFQAKMLATRMFAQDSHASLSSYIEMIESYDSVYWTPTGGVVAVASPSVYVLETSAHAAISSMNSFYGWTFQNIQTKDADDDLYICIAADPLYISWLTTKSFPTKFDRSKYTEQLTQRIFSIMKGLYQTIPTEPNSTPYAILGKISRSDC
jgi:hypothetical protein